MKALRNMPRAERAVALRKLWAKRPDLRVFNPKGPGRFAELTDASRTKRVKALKTKRWLDGLEKGKRVELAKKGKLEGLVKKSEWGPEEQRFRVKKGDQPEGEGSYGPKHPRSLGWGRVKEGKRLPNTKPRDRFKDSMGRLRLGDVEKYRPQIESSSTDRRELRLLLKARRKERGEKFAVGAMSPADLIRRRRGVTSARKGEVKEEPRGLLADYKKKVQESRAKYRQGDGKTPMNPGKRQFTEIMEAQKKGEPLNITERGVVSRSKKMNDLSKEDQILLDRLGPQGLLKSEAELAEFRVGPGIDWKGTDRSNIARRSGLVRFTKGLEKKSKAKVEGSKGRLPTKEEMDGVTEPDAFTPIHVKLDQEIAIGKMDQKFRGIPKEQMGEAERKLQTLRDWEYRRQDRAGKKQVVDREKIERQDLYDPETEMGELERDSNWRDPKHLEKLRAAGKFLRGKNTPAWTMPGLTGKKAKKYGVSAGEQIGRSLGGVPSTEGAPHRAIAALDELEQLDRDFGRLLKGLPQGDKRAKGALKMVGAKTQKLLDQAIFDGVEGQRWVSDAFRRAPRVMDAQLRRELNFWKTNEEKAKALTLPLEQEVADKANRMVKFYSGMMHMEGSKTRFVSKVKGEGGTPRVFGEKGGPRIPDRGSVFLGIRSANKAVSMVTDPNFMKGQPPRVRARAANAWLDRARDDWQYATMKAKPAGQGKSDQLPSAAGKLPRSHDPNDGPAMGERDVEQVGFPKDRTVFDDDGFVVQQGTPEGRWKQEGPEPQPGRGDLPEPVPDEVIPRYQAAASSAAVRPLALQMLAKDLGRDPEEVKRLVASVKARAEAGEPAAKASWNRIQEAFKNKLAEAMRGPRPAGGGVPLDEDGRRRL
jgi:hypothetical protein